MHKLDCHSRESIIDFIEKSNGLSYVQKHYLHLMMRSDFERRLQKISTLDPRGLSLCLIVGSREHDVDQGQLRHLLNDLSLVGIQASLKIIDQGQEDQTLFPSLKLDGFEHVIFLNSDPSNDLDKDQVPYPSSDHYYSSLFEIIKKTKPSTTLDLMREEFQRQYHDLQNGSEYNSLPPQAIENIPSTDNEQQQAERVFKDSFWNIIRTHKVLSLGLSVLCLSFICFLIDFIKEKTSSEPIAVYTNLSLTADATLLKRPDLIAQMNEKLNLQKEQPIKTLALSGIGGAGKTTIARNYAGQQKSPVIWELNAETKESMAQSFEQLAHALSKTEADQKALKGVQTIKSRQEREEKLITFVEAKLKSVSRWLLIYDNVEKVSDVEKYFPTNSSIWGSGVAIITTRDSNIRNNKHINQALSIEELTNEDKLALFIKIISNAEKQQFSAEQLDQMKHFLINIPSFPLDVSIAAYYLKMANISYEKYLERLKANHETFKIVQENIIKGASNYTQTRYGIITLSLQRFIQSRKDFEDLLLFISLLDSQEIPRILLDAYKNEVIVDDFIYYLKKYSLITDESPISSGSVATISIHRSTQEISLDYLLKILDVDRKNNSLEEITNTLESFISVIKGNEDIPKMKILINHYDAFLSHDKVLSPIMRSTIGAELGFVYFYFARYLEGKKLLEQSLLHLNNPLCKKYTSAASAFLHLGIFYRELGDYQKALNLLNQSLSIYQNHSRTHIGAARTMTYLGSVYKELGNFKKARDMFEKSLPIYKIYSKNDAGYAWSLGHLGAIYRDLGDNETAKTVLEQSLSMYKEHSTTHVGVARTLTYLSSIYKNLGDYTKAKQLIDEALHIYKKHFSDDYLEVAWASIYAGEIYKELGDYQKAKKALLQSLQIYEKNYGKNHVETARVLKVLGDTLLLENDIEAAEKLELRAFEIFQQHKHPELYMALESLAELYLKKALDIKNNDDSQFQNFRKQTLESLYNAQEIIKLHFSSNSPHFIRVQNKIERLGRLWSSPVK